MTFSTVVTKAEEPILHLFITAVSVYVEVILKASSENVSHISNGE